MKIKTTKAVGLSAVLWLSMCPATFAFAPDETPRPAPRPEPLLPIVAVAETPVVAGELIRPVPRPTRLSAVPVAEVPVAPTRLAVVQSLRPNGRPKALAQKFAALGSAPVSASRSGRVCGVNDIKGTAVSAIPGKIKGCGISDPVRVTEVSGLKLSQPAVMDCTTAKALNDWVRKGVYPAVGRMGGGPSSLRVAAHYACRTRNNKPGAKISEHGRGRAIDIAGVGLKNGSEISVLKGWRTADQGKALKAMHKAACGPFGTVLGPNADRYHQDHLHLDTARYRSGAYCR